MGVFPFQGKKMHMVELGIETGTSWLVVRSSDHQATRLVRYFNVNSNYNIIYNKTRNATLALLCILKSTCMLYMFIVLLKMDAKGVRNMQSILVVFNKHNTARVESCWFIIYYTRVGTLIVATIYLQLIQNRYMFRSFTVFSVVTSIVYNPLPAM